ncbi:hypothetical protein BKA69DRAFT_1129907, partial [Paraphysoderma sedebokerense]
MDLEGRQAVVDDIDDLLLNLVAESLTNTIGLHDISNLNSHLGHRNSHPAHQTFTSPNPSTNYARKLFKQSSNVSRSFINSRSPDISPVEDATLYFKDLYSPLAGSVDLPRPPTPSDLQLPIPLSFFRPDYISSRI